MIGRLQGTLVGKQPPRLIVDVGGVGYAVDAPMSTIFSLPAAGQDVTLHTHMVVRDDAILLYGFATVQEKDLFLDLIRINGVGPKMALTILSGSSVNDFITIIQTGDTASLTALPGVGKKTAQRLLLEMRDRIDSDATTSGLPQTNGMAPMDPVTEAHRALTALGYKPAEATRLLKDLPAGEGDSESLIRQALQRAVQ